MGSDREFDARGSFDGHDLERSSEAQNQLSSPQTASFSEPSHGVAGKFFRIPLVRSVVENWEFIGNCLLVVFCWILISGLVIVLSLYISAPINTLMFLSSLFSMLASGLILMSGYYSGKKHRTVRSM
jgi:uncharacterized membrane protein